MRSFTNLEKLHSFMREIGRVSQGPGRIYLVGGSTALLLGIREQTLDIDIKLDPEPKAVFEGIAALKNTLNVNIELASPDQFLPALPGWQERSEFIERSGQVDVYHYDFYGQALAKILRGHETDRSDALALVRLGKVYPSRLRTLYDSIKPAMIRYPAIDPEEFESRFQAFLSEVGEESE